MKKRKKVISIIGIIFVIGIMLGCLVGIKKTSKNNVKMSDKIMNQIEKEKDGLIYVTTNDKSCFLCDDAKDFIDFYHEEYGVDFITFNKSRDGEEEFNKILNKLDIDPQIVTEPAVIFVKDKQMVAVANEMISETILKEFLITYGFIEEEDSKYDNQLDLETFEAKLKAPEKSLIAFYTNDSYSYEIRKVMLNLSKKYNISYDVVYSGVSYGAQIRSIMRTKIDNDFAIPLLAVVQNDEVVDYINSSQENEILDFLKKNGMVAE